MRARVEVNGENATLEEVKLAMRCGLTQTTNRQILLVLDNASWHKPKRLNWHHIKPLYLPPYSPDLNPIEILWKVLKDRFFSDWYAKTLEQLEQRVCASHTKK